MKKPIQIMAGALVAGSVLVTAGCGRPSVGDLKDGLVNEISGLTSGQADCIANVLRDSKISDDDLKKIASGKIDSAANIPGIDGKVEAKVKACATAK